MWTLRRMLEVFSTERVPSCTFNIKNLTPLKRFSVDQQPGGFFFTIKNIAIVMYCELERRKNEFGDFMENKFTFPALQLAIYNTTTKLDKIK